jgi:hypothetical protein
MVMETFISQINPDLIMYVGFVGIFLGIFLFFLYGYRRVKWLTNAIRKKRGPSPGPLSSLRNLILILLWLAVFGMAFFLGSFLRAYHAFTYEYPVAEIVVQPTEINKTNLITFTEMTPTGPGLKRRYTIKGDQWMIEGDILKWDNWLNFLGLRTRYRLTRLQGRYLRTQEELREPRSVYSLVDEEIHPYWKYLYRFGQRLPFVSTVYGSAAFQLSGDHRRYTVYVGTTGFLVRQEEQP